MCHLTRGFTQVAAVLGLLAALVGAGHLVAWLEGYLTRRGLSTITMKTNAALCLTLVGVALVLLVVPRAGPIRRWTARTCAALALAVGLLTLVENLSGWDLGIDQLLAVETPGALAVASPNRMGMPASFGFTLTGWALLILSRRDRRGAWVMQVLALTVCLITLLSTIGFLYGAREFYGIARYTGIAWPTAVSLLLLGLGLLCARPAEGLMAQITANDPGGVGLRRLLPPFVLLPLLLGWLRLTGERAGAFDAATGTAMMMLLFIVLFSVLAYHAGRRTSRAAKVRRESEEHLRFALETSHTGAWDLDLVDHTAHRSLEHDRIFGYGRLLPQWTYEMFLEHVVPEDRGMVDAKFRRATAIHSDWSFECRIRRADGAVRWIWAAGRHREDAAGRMSRMAGIVQDITERKQAEEALREWNATLEMRVAQRTAELAQRARQLQKLTLELTQAEERERRRIAVILHEDLQQQIAGAKFHLSLLKGRARDDGQRGQVDAVEEMLKDAIEKSRSLSHDLSPAVVRMNDLDEVLRWLVHRVRTQHGLVVHVEVRGDALLHSEALALFLFRAAQELLFNVVKHAHIRQAAIQVRRVGRYVCLSVSDQGRGFDPQGLKETPGIGLFSIRERTELLGGRLTVKSVAGQGSTVRIVVPDGPKSKDRRRQTEDEEGTNAGGPDPSSVLSPSSSDGALRVVLVDDHDVMREGLAAALKEAPGIELVGEACDGREAIKVALDLEPDVVLMDVSMPLMGGDQATRQIKTRRPETRIIALSMYDEADKKERMFEAGAERYILKTVSTDELLTAIREKSADKS